MGSYIMHAYSLTPPPVILPTKLANSLIRRIKEFNNNLNSWDNIYQQEKCKQKYGGLLEDNEISEVNFDTNPKNNVAATDFTKTKALKRFLNS